MKYCYECGRLTAGEPLYCNFCGRSYDVKLCPRHHVNSRAAEVCSRCGSRELSTPHPKVSGLLRFAAFMAGLAVRVLLVVAALAVGFAILNQLLATPQFQAGLVALAILLGILAWLWTELPEWLRKWVRKSLRRKEHRHDL